MTTFRKRANHNDRPQGFSVIELIVAASMLTVGLSLAGQGTVLVLRIAQQTRHYRLAQDELANQLDRLISNPVESWKLEPLKLEPSPEIQAVLRDVSIVAESIDDEDGRRFVVRMNWKRELEAKPIQLVGWLPPVETDLEQRGEP